VSDGGQREKALSALRITERIANYNEKTEAQNKIYNAHKSLAYAFFYYVCQGTILYFEHVHYIYVTSYVDNFRRTWKREFCVKVQI